MNASSWYANSELVQALLQHLPNGAVFVVDHELRYQLAEGEALRNVGVSSAYFVGKTIFDILGPDIVTDYERLYRRALAGEPFTDEHPVDDHYFQTHGVPLRSADGAVYAVLAVSYDITERKRAEAALRESDERKAFLLKFADAIRPLSNPVEIQQAALQLVGEYLNLDRVLYNEIDPDVTTYTTRVNYAREGFPAYVGRFAMAPFTETVKSLLLGKTLVINNVENEERFSQAERDYCISINVRAFVTVPLIKEGRWVMNVVAHYSKARQWAPYEVSVLEETAERTWAAVERAHAEARQREADERFRTLVQNIRDYAIFRVDPNGIVTEWTERVKGYLPVDVLGKHLSMFYAPEDIAAGEPANELAEAARTGRAEREGTRIRKDGHRIIVDEIATAIRNGEGQLVGFTKISRDITERRRVEAVAKEAEERMRIAVDAGELATWEWDVIHDLAYWNEQHFWLLGLSPQPNPVKSATFLDHVHPEDLARITAELQQTIRYHTPYEAEFRVIRADKVVRWMRGYGRVTEELNGRTTKVSGVMFDVTERKEAEESLGEVRERLQIILNSIPDHAIITNDVNGVITGWNPGAEHTFGWTGNEAIGQLTAITFTPEDRLSGVPEQEMQTAREQGKAADERYHLRRDGSRFYVSGAMSPLYDAAGRLLGYVKVARDLSERQQMEEALREAARRKDEFLAMLAHELRNPLAPIRNVLQIMQLTSADNQLLSESVALMSRQVEHLVRLIDDLLDVSRISRGKIELRRERLDFVTLVQQAVDATRPLFNENQRHLYVQLPNLPLNVDGDATRLTQVVTNLLTNGVRYTGDNGEVWLTLEAADKQAVLRVRDNGIGLAADQLNAIFELFVQVDNSLARAQGGLGLGLTLVRRLSEMHGGRVEARSAGLGQGSEFTVYLPLLPETANEMNSDTTKNAQQTNGYRILIVDDNRDAATTLAMLLKLKKYDVYTRYSGTEALEAMIALQPAVVLFDIGMPGMDGYETARQIRQLPQGKAILLIALTGYGQDEDRRRSAEAGFDGHLVKPVDLQTLLSLLATHQFTQPKT